MVGGIGALGGFFIPPMLGAIADNYERGHAYGLVVFVVLGAIGVLLSIV
ncbi:MAG: hypothetical protein GY861_22945 [bacterium]|nr:hypothetical protein [bacterium]